MSLLDEDLVDKVFLKGVYCVNQHHKLKFIEDWDSTDIGSGVAVIDKDLKAFIKIEYANVNYMQADINKGTKKIPTYNQLAIVLSYFNEINKCLNRMMLPRLLGDTDYWTCSLYDEGDYRIHKRMFTIKKNVLDGYTNIYTGIKWQYETAACIYLEELNL